VGTARKSAPLPTLRRPLNLIETCPKQIGANQGVDAAPQTFERIVFKIFDPKIFDSKQFDPKRLDPNQLDRLDEVLSAGRDSALTRAC
jgi:hypothetical protein